MQNSKLIKFTESIGDATLSFLDSLYEALHFSALCLIHLLQAKSYSPAMRMVLIKQIYFTAVRVLPLFIILASVFGSVFVGVVIVLATKYNLQSEIGSILITFVLNEFAPFFTALLISLRSGAAINTEIAVMRVNKELNTLKHYEIDLIDYLFLPRIISGIISTTSLAILFAILMLMSGYIFTLFYMNMDLHSYKNLLLNAVEFNNFVVLLLKSIAFGFVTMLIPIYSGLKTQDAYTAIPISVLSGMVKLFIALFFIEVISLLLQSL